MTFHTLGIVLAVKNSGEHDRRAHIYTEAHGKLELFAKSARRLSSKLSPHLEPLTFVDCYVVRGRMDHLAGIERCDRFTGLRTSLERLTLAAWAAELVDVMTKPDHPDPRIFTLLTSWFSFLEQYESRRMPERLQLAYVVALLGCLGYGPEVSCCVRCKSRTSGGWVFSVRDGGVLCVACDTGVGFTITDDARNVFTELAAAPPFFRADAYRALPEEMARTLRNILLAEHIDRPLASDRFARFFASAPAIAIPQ